MDINERISTLIEDNLENFELSNNYKKSHYEVLKQEKDDSSSDIDILDYIDTSQSSVSSQWSIINPTVAVPEKIVIKQKSIGTQTDDHIIRFLFCLLDNKNFLYIYIFMLLFLTAFLFSETNEKPLTSSLKELSIIIKELKRDVMQIQELQNSNINFNEMLNYNFTSIMTDIADLKFNMKILKEHPNILRYNFLEENLKDLQNYNRNLTDEVTKLNMLIKNDSNNCKNIKEDILKLNSFVYNIIQMSNNKIQNQCHNVNLSNVNNFDDILSQNKSTNFTSKSETNTTKSYSDDSFSGSWIFRRAKARHTQRREKNSRAWQLVRAYGRELLRWIDKASSISSWYPNFK